MKPLQYLFTKTGTLVYPTADANNDLVSNPPAYNQISLVFYNDLASDGVTPIDPIITGLSGTVTVQARATPDSAWDDINNGILDLAVGGNKVFPQGIFSGIKIICASVAGCEYILVRLDRGQ